MIIEVDQLFLVDALRWYATLDDEVIQFITAGSTVAVSAHANAQNSAFGFRCLSCWFQLEVILLGEELFVAGRAAVDDDGCHVLALRLLQQMKTQSATGARRLRLLSALFVTRAAAQDHRQHKEQQRAEEDDENHARNARYLMIVRHLDHQRTRLSARYPYRLN